MVEGLDMGVLLGSGRVLFGDVFIKGSLSVGGMCFGKCGNGAWLHMSVDETGQNANILWNIFYLGMYSIFQ